MGEVEEAAAPVSLGGDEVGVLDDADAAETQLVCDIGPVVVAERPVELEEGADDASIGDGVDPGFVGRRKLHQPAEDGSAQARDDRSRSEFFGDTILLRPDDPSSLGLLEAHRPRPCSHLDTAGRDVLRVGGREAPEAALEVPELVAAGLAATRPLTDPRHEPGHGDVVGGIPELRPQERLPELLVRALAEPAWTVDTDWGGVHPPPIAPDQLVRGP